MGNISLGQFNASDQTASGTVIFWMTVPDCNMVKSAMVAALTTLGLPSSWQGDEEFVDRAADYGSIVVETLSLYEPPPAMTIPIGTMLPFAGTTAPAGYIKCEGQEVSRTTYADLFAVCGVAYGAGDGLTTFQLPNGKGQTLIGAGQAVSGGSVWSRGTISGTERVTLGVNEIPAHAHPMSPVAGPTPKTVYSASSTSFNSAAGAVETFPTGGGQSHNNTQPSQVIGCFIIYAGV